MNGPVATSPEVKPQDLKLLGDLVALIADPAVAKDRIEKLVGASEEARRLISEAKKTRAEMYAERRENQAAMQRELDEHEYKIGKSQAEHDQALAERERELTIREQKADDLVLRATADREEAAKLKADLERRLGILREATRPAP